ncbi:retrovirus-related pol polyprotein from transposon TNT 1-94, partial [Tanacetum coccineum]
MSKEKEIDKLMALISLSFKKIYKPTNNNLRTSSNISRANQDNSLRINRGTGYENQRVVNVAEARENVGTMVVQKSRIQCYNCKEYGHVSRECQKPKRAKDAAYHKEKNAIIQEVTPDAADNSGPIFDDEPLQKVKNNNDNYKGGSRILTHHGTHLEEQGDTNITIDSLDMCYDREQDDQDDTDELAQERDLFASLIKKLKCEIDDSKNRNNFLKSSNKALVDKLKDLKKFQAELDRYHDVNYASKVAIDYAKAKGDLMAYKIESKKSSNEYTRKINDLNQTISDMKKELCAHQETISIMSQEKEAQIKFYKTREDKELDKVIALENKVKVLDDIVYKTGQSVQTMNILNRNCKTSFAKLEFLKKAQRENPRLYDIGCYNDNLALMLAPESDKNNSRLSQISTGHSKTQFLNKIDRLSREYYYADHINAILGVYTNIDEVSNLQCDYLETLEKCEHLKKELSKSRTMSKSFEALQKHAINLELDLQQCKGKIKNDKYFKENQSNVFLKEREQYFEIQDLKAQLQDKGIAISELKKLIEKMKGKSMETKFEKSAVIRRPNAFKSQRQSILGKPAIFSDSLEKKDFSKSNSVTKHILSNDFSKPVTAQILPQNIKSILKNTNVIALGMYKVHTKPNQTRTSQLPQDIRKTNKRVSFSTGVIPTTSVSRPQLKSNQLDDKVMPNNSQGKKQEVEDHRSNFKFTNNKTYVTTCNDSLNAKTSNVNFVCVTCGKCVLNDNHDMCVLYYINGVNSRTKKPMNCPAFYDNDDEDDDEEYTIRITPVLPTVEPNNSLSMGDKNLSTIPEKKESSAEYLVPIPSESKGISDNMCDVPFCENSHPLDALRDHSEIFFDLNDDYASSDDDPLYSEDIDYVDASPPDSDLVSLEEVKDFDTEDGEIDTDILLTINNDILREKLLNINLLIAKIETLKDNPTPSTSVLKSPSSFPNSFLEETDASDNSLLESEIFCFDMEEKSSGNPTSHSDLSLPDYEAFCCDNEPDS